MNWKADKILTIFLSSSIFILMPFIYSLKLQDVEISLRFLTLAILLGISSVVSIYYTIKTSFALGWNNLLLFGSAFLIINFIGVFRSINPGDGYFEFLKLFLMFQLFYQMIILFSANENNKFIFFKTICISSVIFISFGFFQFLAIVKQGSISDINFALSSSLGNKNFFAETLLMMLPFCMASAFLFRRTWRVIGIFSFISIIVTLIFLQTLSTWLALVISTVVLLLLVMKFRKKLFNDARKLRKFYISFLVVGAIFLIGFIVFYYKGGRYQIEKRIASFKSVLYPGVEESYLVNQNSTFERVFLWKKTAKMIADHPVAGCGLSNWKINLPSYGMGSAEYMFNDAIRFVHPHNDFLLVAAELGLLGIITYLTFLLLLGFYAYRLLSKGSSHEQLIMAFMMFFGLIIFMVISSFSMPMSKIYPPILFMLISAIILSEYSRTIESKLIIGCKINVVICLVALTTAVAAVFAGSTRLKAESHLTKALLADRKKNWMVMRQHLDQIDKTSFPVDYTATPIAWYQGYAWFYLGDLDGAFAAFKEAEKVNPNHLTLLNDLGTCYNLKGDSKTAIEYYQRALAIQPVFYDALINLAVIYFNRGDLERSFATVIRVTGVIERGSISNIGAIILAKAKTVITDEAQLIKLEKITKNTYTMEQLLIDLRQQNGDIQLVIRNM